MSKFGWNYPAGCSGTPDDEPCGCEVCGKDIDNCKCPDSPVSEEPTAEDIAEWDRNQDAHIMTLGTAEACRGCGRRPYDPDTPGCSECDDTRSLMSD